MPHQSITADNIFDVIVIGVGSMGAAACYYLAKRGYKVLGIEQFDITHEFGSHAGQSRIIRKAYFEHPDYVPLLQRAYANWSDLEKENGEQVYYQAGLVYFGSPEHEMIKGVKRSAGLYNIPLNVSDSKSAARQFPAFSIPGDFESLFEPEAGFITPEKVIKLYARLANSYGATIHIGEKAISWKKTGDSITVQTDKDIYHCGQLIISSGAWSGKLAPVFREAIKATRQFVAWVRPKKEKGFLLNEFPCWMIADDERPGCYYGFPVLPEDQFGEPNGLKLAYHYPGEISDPDRVNRETTADDMENIRYVMDKYLPGIFDSVVATKTCLYSNTPDEHFIIDRLPGYEDQVTIACGFSGHGFKFASVIGEVLADLAITGRTDHPVGFLGAKRFL
ncbi:MAG: N-methyl-L-tryptophan oxidase [Chitinophagaceae bacterium]|nr:N-methyl-L-tryptophan oxidase [Chitinophagaceae bacterium]